MISMDYNEIMAGREIPSLMELVIQISAINGDFHQAIFDSQRFRIFLCLFGGETPPFQKLWSFAHFNDPEK